MKIYLFFLFLLLCTGCNTLTPGQGGSEKMKFEFSYTDSSSDMSLVITEDGLATLTIGDNRADPDFDAVGLFRARLSPQHLSDLVSSMQAGDFRNVQSPDSALPGEAVRQLRLKMEGGDEIMKWAAFNTPTPPEFAAVEERALTIVRLMRQYPVCTIAVKATGLPREIERDIPVEFDVVFINPGSETVKVEDPDKWSGEVANLQIVGLRSDIPLEDLADYHQKFEELTKESIVDIQAEKPDGPLIPIPSKGSLTFRVRTPLDWPPGHYDVQLSLYVSLFDKDDAELLDCQLLSRPYPVKIVGDSKPEDDPGDEDEEDEGEDVTGPEA